MSLTLGPLAERRLAFTDLADGDVVFDVGGNLGEWAKGMVERYCVFCHIFEPMPYLATNLALYCGPDAHFIVHDAALGDHDGTTMMAFAGYHGDASGEWATGERTLVRVKDVVRVLPPELAVMKLNCEGGEYAILERLIDTDLIRRCRHIQVQFHDCFDGANERADAIRTSLASTHTLAWADGTWGFEEWRRV